MQERTSVAGPTFGRNYKWAIVLMLWIVSFFNYADRSAITAIFPVLRSDYHFTAAELGLLGSAFLGMLVWSRVSGKRSTARL